MVLEVEVRGLQEAQDKMAQIVRDLHGQEMLDAMREATLAITAEAKTLAPVDVGRYRASITPEVTLDGTTLLGVVGTVVEYAPAIEVGRRPMEVPIDELATWARRKGLNVYAIQAVIRKRGTRPQAVFQRAFEARYGDAVAAIERGVRNVVDK